MRYQAIPPPHAGYQFWEVRDTEDTTESSVGTTFVTITEHLSNAGEICQQIADDLNDGKITLKWL